VNLLWKPHPIPDDDPLIAVSNARGTVAFATAGPNTRTTQIFVNTKRDSRDEGCSTIISGNAALLDDKGFMPFGEVIGDGMDVIDDLYAGYGEGPPSGMDGPVQALIREQGNVYLELSFPKLSYISRATSVEDTKNSI
jgi:peptidyl-prolyl cis-trans isomerase A (cyclophilin A)